MMKKFLFYILSKDDNFQLSENDFKAISTNNTKYDIQYIFCKNNTEPLTKKYNEILNNNHSFDFIVFLHSDVKLDLQHLIEHIIECESKYDVFGLCGTSIFNVSQKPLNWFTGSNPTPKARWGCVTHGELENQKSFFNADRKNILDHEVACIDGLCIIFGPKALNFGMRFDENLKFDCYDTDISMQTILSYKLTLGVLVEESLQHYSVGKSILSPEFLIYDSYLRKKWNF